MSDGDSFVSIGQLSNGSANPKDERALENLKGQLKGWYFAYGSNMNPTQIHFRCSQPRVIGAARLADYRLKFYGYSSIWDGALETVRPALGEEVWGVLYALNPADWEQLDVWQDARMDGAGQYFHYPVTVTDRQGQEHFVSLYKKDEVRVPSEPSQEYLDYIVQGAIKHELPPDYVEKLKQQPAKKASYKVPKLVNMTRNFGVSSCSDCGSGEL